MIKKLLSQLYTPSPYTRAISAHEAEVAIYNEVMQAVPDLQMVGIYYNDDNGRQERFAILQDMTGGLYRLDFVVVDNQVLYPSRELKPVSIEFVPSQRASIVGERLVLIQSANAIPTRDGHLDTSGLLQSFVRLEDDTGIRPQVDTYHNNVRVGEVIDSYIGNGKALFDLIQLDDTPIGNWLYNDMQRADGFWGASNEFYATRQEIETIDGVDTKILDGRGVRTWVSILPESLVANHNTKAVALSADGENRGNDNMAQSTDELLDVMRSRGVADDQLQAIKAQMAEWETEIANNPNARSAETVAEEATPETTESVEAAEEVVAEIATEEIETPTEETVTAIADELTAELVEPVAELEDVAEIATPDAPREELDGEVLAEIFNYATAEQHEEVVASVATLTEANTTLKVENSELKTAVDALSSELEALKATFATVEPVLRHIQNSLTARQKATTKVEQPVAQTHKVNKSGHGNTMPWHSR